MQILLSPKTSAQIWLLARKVEARTYAQARDIVVFDTAAPISPYIPLASQLLKSRGGKIEKLKISASSEEILGVKNDLGLSSISLSVKDKRQRRNHGDIQWTVMPEQLANMPVYKLMDGVYLCSPYASFICAISHFQRPIAAQLLTELCGKYALDTGIEHGFGSCTPLLRVDKLRQLSQVTRGTHGIRSLRSSIPYVVPNSESPRETDLQLSLGLPRVDGAFKLPLGIFGYEVKLGTKARQIYGRKSCRCDLYYPDARLTLEYQSDQEHAGETNRKNDARREAALALEGIETISVTSQEIGSLAHMESLAHLVANKLGIPLRIEIENFKMRQLKLMETLLSRKEWSL